MQKKINLTDRTRLHFYACRSNALFADDAHLGRATVVW